MDNREALRRVDVEMASRALTRRKRLRGGAAALGNPRNGRRSPALGALLALALAPALAGAWWAGGSGQAAFADDTSAQRRAKIEAMSPEQREDLAERRRRFAQLDAEEQSRLRELAKEIDSDPEAEKLQEVMQQYYDWLKTLLPFQQAALKELPPDARIAKIKSLREEQAKREAAGGGPNPFFGSRGPRRWQDPGFAQYGVPITPADIEAMFGWLDGYIKREAPAFFEKLPPDKQSELKRKLQEVRDPLQRNEQLGLLWLRFQLQHREKGVPLSDSDLNDLRLKLSPSTRSRLELLPPADQRRWVLSILPMYMFWQFAARRGGGPPASFKAEDLSEFFANRLPAEQRDKLLRLPGEQMQYELWRMYVASKYGGPPPGWGKRPPGRGGRNPKGDGKALEVGPPPDRNPAPQSGSKTPPEKGVTPPVAESKTS